MAISPNKLENVLTANDQKIIDELEKSIDNKLTINYSGGTATTIYLNKYISPRHQNMIKARYVQAGWKNVTFTNSSDPREAGTSISVTFYK